MTTALAPPTGALLHPAGRRTPPTWQRTIRRSLLPLLLILAGMLTVAPAAQAAPYGNAYLVVNNSRCVGGGSVTGIYGAVDNVWSGGDSGDNIIYARVDRYRVNTFNGRAYCSRAWYAGGDYWINVTWWQFTPSAAVSTFWY